VSSDTTSPSDKNRASGLWLWHGKPPLPPSPPQPASRVQQSVNPIVSALRKGGWMALPGGVALTLLAVMLRLTPPDKPAPTDTPAVALEPVPSPAVALEPVPSPAVALEPVSSSAEAHAVIPAPRVEHADAQLDQAQMPSAPAALLPALGTEHQLAKKAAHHTSARTVRKAHPFAGRGSPFSIHGVLTPPGPTVWHGRGD
jgi:hypothetical protein